MKFIEIEHKFLLEDEAQIARLVETIKALSPRKHSSISVVDTYFVSEHAPNLILRHRFDEELQQLTYKNFGQGTEVRHEINLDLGHHNGNQSDQVQAFCYSLGYRWEGLIRKQVHAFYFDDCELVIYQARGNRKLVQCVEIEAVNPSTTEHGLGVLQRYEDRLGLKAEHRCQQSLFELIFPEQAAKLHQNAAQ